MSINQKTPLADRAVYLLQTLNEHLLAKKVHFHFHFHFQWLCYVASDLGHEASLSTILETEKVIVPSATKSCAPLPSIQGKRESGPQIAVNMASPSAEAAQNQAAQPADAAAPAGDDSQTRRPRDARLIQLVLSSLGVHSYQERVPLQLLDFAYRYTSSVLSDSLRLSAEGYTAAATGGTGGTASSRRAEASGAGDGSNITVTALRQAIASRQDYTFQGPALPKEFMKEQANERNRVMLPKVEKSWGVQLPPERYCLTGTAWNLKEEWDSEGEDEEEEQNKGEDKVKSEVLKAQTNGDGDRTMGGMEDDGDEEDAEGGTFEDVFGGGGGGAGGGDGDREMGEG